MNREPGARPPRFVHRDSTGGRLARLSAETTRALRRPTREGGNTTRFAGSSARPRCSLPGGKTETIEGRRLVGETLSRPGRRSRRGHDYRATTGRRRGISAGAGCKRRTQDAGCGKYQRKSLHAASFVRGRLGPVNGQTVPSSPHNGRSRLGRTRAAARNCRRLGQSGFRQRAGHATSASFVAACYSL
jgi:hypothetical protein